MIIPLSFANKKIICTGAGRGLGKALVQSIVERDGTVFALSKTKEKLAELKKELPQVSTICVDLADWNETRRIVQGIEPVDMLVNNAGVNIPGYMMKITQEDFNKTINSNVLSCLNVTQIVAEKMIANKINGSIVNISSIAERIVIDRQGMYGISKMALSMQSKCFAAELGQYNIRVNCVSPGLFPTDMSKKALDNPNSRMVASVLSGTPLKRIANVEEIVNAVLFLLHDSSSYINGQSVFLCGGFTK